MSTVLGREKKRNPPLWTQDDSTYELSSEGQAAASAVGDESANGWAAQGWTTDGLAGRGSAMGSAAPRASLKVQAPKPWGREIALAAESPRTGPGEQETQAACEQERQAACEQERQAAWSVRRRFDKSAAGEAALSGSQDTPAVGDRVRVEWLHGAKGVYDGTVIQSKSEVDTLKGLGFISRFYVEYDDGDERWETVGGPTIRLEILSRSGSRSSVGRPVPEHFCRRPP